MHARPRWPFLHIPTPANVCAEPGVTCESVDEFRHTQRRTVPRFLVERETLHLLVVAEDSSSMHVVFRICAEDSAVLTNVETSALQPQGAAFLFDELQVMWDVIGNPLQQRFQGERTIS